MKIAYNITSREIDLNIYLDTIKDSSISVSSHVSTHPIATGEIIADHKYDEPITLRISGTFSLNQGSEFKFSRLSTVQTLFESIKTKGILCDITKISMNENKNSLRFLTRRNMVLQDITWVEKINTLEFTFTFLQIMYVDTRPTKVDTTDVYLPDIEGVDTCNFTETLLDFDALDTIIVEICKGTGFMTEEYANYIEQFGTGALDIYSSLVPFASISIRAGKLLGESASGKEIGLTEILEEIGHDITGSAIGIYELGKAIYESISQYNYGKAVFNLYKDNEKLREQTNQNYAEFSDNIHQAFAQFNDVIDIYQVSVNKPQTCIVNLRGEFYQFVFEKNTIDGYYYLSVYNMSGELYKNVGDIRAAYTTIGDLTPMFYTSNNYPVYLLNLADKTSNSVIKNMTLSDSRDENDLTNYYIMSSSFDLKQIDTKVKEAVNTAIARAL